MDALWACLLLLCCAAAPGSCRSRTWPCWACSCLLDTPGWCQNGDASREWEGSNSWCSTVQIWGAICAALMDFPNKAYTKREGRLEAAERVSGAGCRRWQGLAAPGPRIRLPNSLRREVARGSTLLCKGRRTVIGLDRQRPSWRFWWRGCLICLAGGWQLQGQTTAFPIASAVEKQRG